MVIFHSYVSNFQSVLHRFMALQVFIVDRVLYGIVLLFIVMESPNYSDFQYFKPFCKVQEKTALNGYNWAYHEIYSLVN